MRRSSIADTGVSLGVATAELPVIQGRYAPAAPAGRFEHLLDRSRSHG
jgi:hypothetical protein